ncbi:hypothetical protein NO2_0941 [Candidatus Termititenax persephonae]|uniref:PorV/PorQ family protein n=1 Tax=Candidatus Termititenax persephonae TaxID=2218525 RepID=A0A388TI17_9BACT|nr:hypothetical protein NO2_0941 [Candidatus Termititenax persephonae]
MIAACCAAPVDLLDRTSGLAVLSCGGAGTARTNGLNAAYWNPAGLVFPAKSGLEFTYYQNLGLVNHISLDGWLLLGNGAAPFGFNYVQESINDIPRTSEFLGQAVQEGSFSDEYQFINLSTAAPLNAAGLYGGVNYKIISRVLDKHQAGGFAADAGLIQTLGQDWSFGAVLRNIFSNLEWDTGIRESLARKLTVGAAYRLRLPDFDNYFFADYDLFSEDLSGWAAGMESWLMRDIFCLRGGYNSNQELTFGSGLRYADFHCDFALLFRPAESQLADSFLFALGFDFKITTAAAVSAAKAPSSFQPRIVAEKNRIVIANLNPEELQEIAVLDPDSQVRNIPVDTTISIPTARSGTYTILFQFKNQQIVRKIVKI